MLNTLAKHPLLAEKGAAAPSHDDRIADVQVSQFAPTNEPSRTRSDSLAGMIKRAGPARPAATPTATPAPVEPVHQNVVAEGDVPDISMIGLIRRGERPTISQPEIAAPSPASYDEAPKRRQLTVRISMGQFEKLDALARRTGQSYQDIQVKAIEQFLKGTLGQ